MRDARCLITTRYCHKAFTQGFTDAALLTKHCIRNRAAGYSHSVTGHKIWSSDVVGCNSAISRSHSSAVFPFSSSPFSAIHSGSNGRDCYFYCEPARNPSERGSEGALSLSLLSGAIRRALQMGWNTKDFAKCPLRLGDSKAKLHAFWAIIAL